MATITPSSNVTGITEGQTLTVYSQHVPVDGILGSSRRCLEARILGWSPRWRAKSANQRHRADCSILKSSHVRIRHAHGVWIKPLRYCRGNPNSWPGFSGTRCGLCVRPEFRRPDTGSGRDRCRPIRDVRRTSRLARCTLSIPHGDDLARSRLFHAETTRWCTFMRFAKWLSHSEW